MTKPPTAVHHTAGKLWDSIYRRSWRKAYQAADALDTVLFMESGGELNEPHLHPLIVDLAEERFKRAQFV